MLGMLNRTKFTTWVALTLGAVSVVVMRDISLLLGSIQSDTAASYSATVLFEPRLHPGDGTTDIINAWEVWRTFAGRERLVGTHLVVDVIYIAAYGFLLWRVLGALGIPALRVRWLVGFVVGLDLIENALTALVLILGNASRGTWVLPWASDAKWLAVTVALVTVLLGWLVGRAGERSAGAIAAQVVEHARREASTVTAPTGTARPWSRLKSQLVVAGAFALLIALPAGGALDQIPDVLRHSLEDPWPTLPASVFALLLLAVSVLISGYRAALLDHTPDLGGVAPPRAPGRSFGQLAIAALVGAGLVFIGGRLLADPLQVAPFAGPIVVVAIVVLGFLLPLALGLAPPVDDPTVDAPDPASATRLRWWLAALPSVVLLAGALGLIRAVTPVLLVDPTGKWLVWAIVALLSCLTVPLINEGLNRALDASAANDQSILRLGFWASVGAVVIIVAALAFFPLVVAPWLGATGVVAVSLAGLVLALGELARRSEFHQPWKPLARLVPLRRTPYVLLLLVVGLTASSLDTKGGYHDIRVSADNQTQAAYAHGNLAAAWTSWLETTSTCGTDRTRPMLLIAAPGGGIRAAYWTALGLDELSEACPEAIFSVSSVSGGSVGSMAWSLPEDGASSDTDAVTAQEVVAGFSTGAALSTSMAGFLLHDVPRSIVPYQEGIDDRADLLERSWEASLDTHQSLRAGGHTTFGALKAPRTTWRPVLMFNGTSVSDGCRVVTTNVAGLTDESTGPETPPQPKNCLDSTRNAALSAAVDIRADHYSQGESFGASCTPGDEPPVDVRATTAALLSARFPIISPAGTARRCVKNPKDDSVGTVGATYVVDGGYAENSGLLSLLQLWEQLQPMVDAYNASEPDTVVVPWFLVLDNHYLGNTSPRAPQRVRELTAPIKALGNASASASPAALEQIACRETTQTPVQPATDERMPGRCRLVVISPRKQPAVTAPLGWTLSQTTRSELDGQWATGWANASALRAALTCRSVE